MSDEIYDDFFSDAGKKFDSGHELKYCNQYHKQNRTVFVYGGYEGIPQTLLLNVIAWIFLILIFSFVRKKAWNYGRLALVQKARPKWTQIFYGNTSELSTHIISGDNESSISSVDQTITVDKGLFSWIVAIFKVTDEHILTHSGEDAIQYLSFQHHIIVYMIIVTVISLAVVLPLNFQGDLEGDSKVFGHTTISNLDPNSLYLWFHVTIPVLFLALGIGIMRRFSLNLKVEKEETSISRTLVITKVPKAMCTKHYLLQHFEEAYSNTIEIQDIQFAYNIRRLMWLDKDSSRARDAKRFCENYTKSTGDRLEMRPYSCGYICCCCDMFGCPKVDALVYYTEELNRLSNELDTERAMALRKPLGISFVTYGTVNMASQVFKDHQLSYKCSVNPPCSSLSRELEPHNWHVHFAPPPEDIFWENLSVGSEHWYIRAFFINFFLFLFLFFITTPAYVITILETVQLTTEFEKMSPFLSEFAPTLLLWTISAVMPVLVSYSDEWMSHWTRSGQNHAIMRKTFIFLLFMVIILPSLGLTSAKAFVEWAVRTNNDTGPWNYRWECVFLPDNGAFFVNYVITSALIGTAFELIRLPELLLYVFRLCLTRSNAETDNVRKHILYEFPFGAQYAWMMMIFAMTLIYSLLCPLITPFGLLYMVMKHCVDRHNIIFSYGPSKIRKGIHASAINYVVASIIMLQLCLLFFMLLRRGLVAITIFSITAVCLSVSLFASQVFFGWFSAISAFHKQTHTDDGSDFSQFPKENDKIHVYLPRVLQPQPILDESHEDSPVDENALPKMYGSNANTDIASSHSRSSVDSEKNLYQNSTKK